MNTIKRIISSTISTVYNQVASLCKNIKGMALMAAATVGIANVAVFYGATVMVALAGSALSVLMLSR